MCVCVCVCVRTRAQANLTDVLSKLPSSFSSCSLMFFTIVASVDTSVVSSEPAVLIRL